jgi:integrase/recombinase XerD
LYLYTAMNTNIVISLDTRRAKKDGTYPLVMRLGHNERTTSILIGISIHEKDWDVKNRLIKKSYSGVNSVSRLNNMIQKKKTDAMDTVLKLNESGELATLSLIALKDKLVKENKGMSFCTFTQEIIEDLKKANRIGTARSYKGTMSVLKEFNKGKDLSFSDITYSFLIKFETAHLQKGNTYNGLAVYMRTIRAIYNKAIKTGVVEKEWYPFEAYKIKTEPTEKRALEWSLLKKIIELNIDKEHACFNARNYFVASYMMYGMNFTDMAFLKKEDVIRGRIQYRRKKTSKLYDIKITPQLDTILTYYKSIQKESDYLFPILKRSGAILQDRDIMWARKRYNKKLKILAELCKIETNLTSYVSRHSFATQAMLHQVPLNAISTMLGHSSLKTTEVYIKSLPSNILDEYNTLLMQD